MSKPFAPRRLYTPRTSRTLAPRLDPEAVGRTTESIARFSEPAVTCWCRRCSY